MSVAFYLPFVVCLKTWSGCEKSPWHKLKFRMPVSWLIHQCFVDESGEGFIA